MKKRIILAAVLSLAAMAPVHAQSMYDGYNFSSTEYLGTAKSLALGGAVTALGGDLGTIGINPAGSAVAGYSQFTITPALSLSLGSAAYAPGYSSPYEKSRTALKGRMKLPNVGATFRFDSNDGSDALRSVTMGFVVNSVADYNSSFRTKAVTRSSSRFAEMAQAANSLGILPSDLGSSSFYDNSAYSNYWDVAMGYNVGLINSYGNASDKKYVGSTELVNGSGEHWIPGDLRHSTNVTHYGYRSDMVFNVGLDFGDRFFAGVNLGMPVLSYSNVETWTETAVNPDLFPIDFNYSDGSTASTSFSDASYRYNYTASATGVYLKAGLIYLPTSWLRLGLAYQTRTVYDVSETWQHSGQVRYTDSGFNASGSGLLGTYEYNFYAPSVLDAGIALTFGRLGLLSFDYELTNYSRMRFTANSDDFGFSTDTYSEENAAIKAFSAPSHNFRAGAELNLTRDIALRLGGSLLIGPEVYYGDNEVTYADYDEDYYLGRKSLAGLSKHYYTKWQDLTCSASAGLGYNPRGSFFADFAVRLTKYPSMVYQPYSDYTDYEGYSVEAPRISQDRRLLSALLTLGWRF